MHRSAPNKMPAAVKKRYFELIREAVGVVSRQLE